MTLEFNSFVGEVILTPTMATDNTLLHEIVPQDLSSIKEQMQFNQVTLWSGVIGMRIPDNPVEFVESTLYLMDNPTNHAIHHKLLNLPFTMSKRYGGNILKLYNRPLPLYRDRIMKLLI